MERSATHLMRDPWPAGERRRSIIWFAAMFALLGIGWWRETAHVLGHGASHVAPVAAAFGARCAAWLVEAAFYVAWWSAWGRRLAFWHCLRWIVVFSGCTLVGASLARLAAAHPVSAAWLAPFVGPGALAGPLASAGQAIVPPALHDAGLLTALRIGLTADLQARAVGVGRARALALCAGVWLLSRLAYAMVADFARGQSPAS